jgi:hypothetical protein
MDRIRVRTSTTSRSCRSLRRSTPKKSVPWVMSALLSCGTALQENRLGDGARQKLASDINVAILAEASLKKVLSLFLDGTASSWLRRCCARRGDHERSPVFRTMTGFSPSRPVTTTGWQATSLIRDVHWGEEGEESIRAGLCGPDRFF